MNSKEVKLLLKQLNEQFGLETLPSGAFMRRDDEKVFLVSRDIENIPVDSLRIESAGLYIGKMQPDGFRLSIEGSQLFGPLCKKNIVELSREQKHNWMKGYDVEILHEDAIVIARSERDFIGSGKIKNGVLLNSVPKSRRLAVVNEDA